MAYTIIRAESAWSANGQPFVRVKFQKRQTEKQTDQSFFSSFAVSRRDNVRSAGATTDNPLHTTPFRMILLKLIAWRQSNHVCTVSKFWGPRCVSQGHRYCWNQHRRYGAMRIQDCRGCTRCCQGRTRFSCFHHRPRTQPVADVAQTSWRMTALFVCIRFMHPVVSGIIALIMTLSSSPTDQRQHIIVFCWRFVRSTEVTTRCRRQSASMRQLQPYRCNFYLDWHKLHEFIGRL